MGNREERNLAYTPIIPYNSHMRYLGVDYGSKKVGLALSDEQGTMGFPYAVVANTPRLVDELCARIAKENVGAVVIGESPGTLRATRIQLRRAPAHSEILSRAFLKKRSFMNQRRSRAPRRVVHLRESGKTRAPKARGMSTLLPPHSSLPATSHH